MMMAKIAQDRSRKPKRIKMRGPIDQESSKRAHRETQEPPKEGNGKLGSGGGRAMAVHISPLSDSIPS
eukprot:8857683-Karenia_brevis.AAC.1